MAIIGPKNDKTILPYIFEDLTEGLEPMRPPQPPKKPTFWKYWKSSWKLVIFKKVGFLGGQRGGSWFLTLQNDFIYHCLLIFFIWGSKKPFYPKNQYLKIWIFKLFRGLGGSPSENFFPKMVPNHQPYLGLKSHWLLDPKISLNNWFMDVFP